MLQQGVCNDGQYVDYYCVYYEFLYVVLVDCMQDQYVQFISINYGCNGYDVDVYYDGGMYVVQDDRYGQWQIYYVQLLLEGYVDVDVSFFDVGFNVFQCQVGVVYDWQQ